MDALTRYCLLFPSHQLALQCATHPSFADSFVKLPADFDLRIAQEQYGWGPSASSITVWKDMVKRTNNASQGSEDGLAALFAPRASQMPDPGPAPGHEADAVPQSSRQTRYRTRSQTQQGAISTGVFPEANVPSSSGAVHYYRSRLVLPLTRSSAGQRKRKEPSASTDESVDIPLASRAMGTKRVRLQTQTDAQPTAQNEPKSTSSTSPPVSIEIRTRI